MGVLVRGLRSHGLAIAIGLPLLMRVLAHILWDIVPFTTLAE